MGVDTRAVLNSITDLEDLKQIVEGYLDLQGPVRVREGYSKTCMLVTFEFRLKKAELDSTGEWRSMFVHFSKGRMEISLGAGEKAWAAEAHHIMRTILMVTGGIFQEYDHSDRMEEIVGILEPSNGIMFHVRNSIVKGELELTRSKSYPDATYIVNCNDVEGLGRVIKEWEEKYPR